MGHGNPCSHWVRLSFSPLLWYPSWFDSHLIGLLQVRVNYWWTCLNPASLPSLTPWHVPGPSLGLPIGVLSIWTHKVIINLIDTIIAVRTPTTNPYLTDYTWGADSGKENWWIVPLDTIFWTAGCPFQGPSLHPFMSPNLAVISPHFTHKVCVSEVPEAPQML